ncbi:hypothetical protein Dimus_018544 [Dionaea muscipula]
MKYSFKACIISLSWMLKRRLQLRLKHNTTTKVDGYTNYSVEVQYLLNNICEAICNNNLLKNIKQVISSHKYQMLLNHIILNLSSRMTTKLIIYTKYNVRAYE